MSAWVVSKTHVDLMVRAAMHYGPGNVSNGRFEWWQTNEDGEYAGWFKLDANAESLAPIDGYAEFVTPSQAGQMLVDANVTSVCGRYPDCDPDAGDLPGPCDAYYMGPYVYTDPGYVLTPAEVFKAIACFDYQSCEYDGWRTSSAYQFCQTLRDDACRAIDGYEAAPWGFDSVPVRS